MQLRKTVETKKMKFGGRRDFINITNNPKFHRDSLRDCRYIKAKLPLLIA